MKATFSVIAIALFASASAFAQHHDAESSFTCKTAPNQYGGFTAITVTLSDAYDAEITGTQSGGIAQFIRDVGPYNVKVSHEADSSIYTNNDGVELFLATTPIGGKLVTGGTFKEGAEFPTLSMTCSNN
jgi:hypothetical protein